MTDPLKEKSALERQVDLLQKQVEDLRKELDLQHQEIHDVYRALAVPTMLTAKLVAQNARDIAALKGVSPTADLTDPLEEMFNLPTHDPEAE